jgi:hypothetical protein
MKLHYAVLSDFLLLQSAMQDLSVLRNVQSGYGAQPAFYPMGSGSSFAFVKSARGVKLTTHLHLVPRLRMVELHLHSPIYLYGIVLN